MIKVTVFLKSTPGTHASIDYKDRDIEDVYDQYGEFMALATGTLTHRGPNSIQIIDRTDVSMVDIQEIK